MERKPALLTIENLQVVFGQGARAFRAVDSVSLNVAAGEVLAVESYIAFAKFNTCKISAVHTNL